MPPAKKVPTEGEKSKRHIDLDAKRVARLEAGSEPVVITLDGHEYTLPVEAPAGFVLLLERGDLPGAVGSLFGSESAEAVMSAMSFDDLKEFLEAVTNEYGIAEGEAPASPST